MEINDTNVIIEKKEKELEELMQNKKKEEKKLEEVEYFFDVLTNEKNLTIIMDKPYHIDKQIFHHNDAIHNDIVKRIKELILPEKEKIISETKEEIKNIQAKILDMFKE